MATQTAVSPVVSFEWNPKSGFYLGLARTERPAMYLATAGGRMGGAIATTGGSELVIGGIEYYQTGDVDASRSTWAGWPRGTWALPAP